MMVVMIIIVANFESYFHTLTLSTSSNRSTVQKTDYSEFNKIIKNHLVNAETQKTDFKESSGNFSVFTESK